MREAGSDAHHHRECYLFGKRKRIAIIILSTVRSPAKISIADGICLKLISRSSSKFSSANRSMMYVFPVCLAPWTTRHFLFFVFVVHIEPPFKNLDLVFGNSYYSRDCLGFLSNSCLFTINYCYLKLYKNKYMSKYII